MTSKEAGPACGVYVHDESATFVPRVTLGILDLPIELRETIYRHMLLGQTLHMCPANNKEYEHSQSVIYEEPGESSFYLGLINCTNKHFQHLTQPVHYSAKQMDCSLLAPADILNFMLSCRTICTELEPLFWSLANFAIGISQFAGFYDDVLSLKIRGSRQLRSHLVSKLQIAIPRVDGVINAISHDFDCNVDAVAALDGSVARSVALLSTECPSLQSVTLTTGLIHEETRRIIGRPRDYLTDYYQEPYPLGKAFYLRLLIILENRVGYGTSRELACGGRNMIRISGGVHKSALVEMARRYVEHCESGMRNT